MICQAAFRGTSTKRWCSPILILPNSLPGSPVFQQMLGEYALVQYGCPYRWKDETAPSCRHVQSNLDDLRVRPLFGYEHLSFSRYAHSPFEPVLQTLDRRRSLGRRSFGSLAIKVQRSSPAAYNLFIFLLKRQQCAIGCSRLFDLDSSCAYNM